MSDPILSDIDIKIKRLWSKLPLIWYWISSRKLFFRFFIEDGYVNNMPEWKTVAQTPWETLVHIQILLPIHMRHTFGHDIPMRKSLRVVQTKSIYFWNKCRKEADPTWNDSEIKFLGRLKIDWRWCHLNSESVYVGSDSYRHWLQK